ncbi:hypothetical protein LTR53_013584 [Teratosphaeriaceae sp. CCFEE 6253]|nr:hypothetical protein LTR53_013584 [Teratosphaeriaceae sp. CCFEE 6253]
MCNHYFFSHPACGHDSKALAQPCEEARARGTNCDLPPGRDPGNRFEVRYPDEVYQQHQSTSADHAHQGQQQAGGEGPPEVDMPTGSEEDAESLADEEEPDDAPSWRPGLSIISERTEATRATARPAQPRTSGSDFDQFNDAALDAATEQLWTDQQRRSDAELREALKRSRREAPLEATDDEIEQIKAMSLEECGGHLDYLLETSFAESAKGAEVHEAWLIREARQAFVMEAMEAFERRRGGADGSDDGDEDDARTIRGVPALSMRSQQASMRHVDDEDDRYTRAGSIREGKARATEPPPPANPSAASQQQRGRAGGPPYPPPPPQPPQSPQGMPNPFGRAPPQPSQQPTQQHGPYPTVMNPHIPTPPQRSPSPAATIRRTMSSADAEDLRRRALFNSRPLRPPAEEADEGAPAPRQGAGGATSMPPPPPGGWPSETYAQLSGDDPTGYGYDDSDEEAEQAESEAGGDARGRSRLHGGERPRA